MAQGPVAERVDAFIETGADPRDLGLGDPGVNARGDDQDSSTARVKTPWT